MSGQHHNIGARVIHCISTIDYGISSPGCWISGIVNLNTKITKVLSNTSCSKQCFIQGKFVLDCNSDKTILESFISLLHTS